MKKIMKTVSAKSAPRVGRWAAVAGAALVLSAGLVMRGGAEPEVGLQPEGVPGASAAVAPQISLPSERESLAPPTVATYLDPEETLAEFWGEEWPDVQGELFPGGLDAVGMGPIQPWPEVEELHFQALDPIGSMRVEALYRKLVAWPGWEYRGAFAERPDSSMAKLTPDSLFWATRVRGTSDMSQEDVEKLEGDFRPLNSELDGLARAYIDGLGAAVRFEFNHGGFDRAPLCFRDVATRSASELYSHKVAAGGWVTRIQIEAADFPGLALLKEQLDSLREKRKGLLRERVAAFRLASQPAS